MRRSTPTATPSTSTPWASWPAHLSGPIAGGAWPNPLQHGAHLVSMSTYKSLGGPPSGLLVTNDATIAERLDAIAFPGLTANFDVGAP